MQKRKLHRKTPKVCKFWSKSKSGCKRDTSCDFLHETLAQRDGKVDSNERQEVQDYKCIGCERVWTDSRCIVEHIVSNQLVYFCLNCDDWVRDKMKVLDANWSLFDDRGNLRNDV
jgi:hypothetical protein